MPNNKCPLKSVFSYFVRQNIKIFSVKMQAKNEENRFAR